MGLFEERERNVGLSEERDRGYYGGRDGVIWGERGIWGYLGREGNMGLFGEREGIMGLFGEMDRG